MKWILPEREDININEQSDDTRREAQSVVGVRKANKNTSRWRWKRRLEVAHYRRTRISSSSHALRKQSIRSKSVTMLFSDRLSTTKKTSITVMWRVSFAEVMKERKKERRVAWHTLFSISWHPCLIVLGNVSIRHLPFSPLLFISFFGPFARKTTTTTP